MSFERKGRDYLAMVSYNISSFPSYITPFILEDKKKGTWALIEKIDAIYMTSSLFLTEETKEEIEENRKQLQRDRREVGLAAYFEWKETVFKPVTEDKDLNELQRQRLIMEEDRSE